MPSLFESIPSMIALVTVVIAAAVGCWMWLRRRKAAPAGSDAQASGQAGSPTAADDLAILFRNASKRLFEAKSKGEVDDGSIERVPVVLVFGPAQSGKTAAVVDSGLRPEPQVIQACSAAAGESREAWQIWLTNRTVFIEVPASAAADSDCLKRLARRLRPSLLSLVLRRQQASRVILFCIDYPALSQQTEIQVADLAKAWNARLIGFCDALGAQTPVYVLCGKLDTADGFSEYVAPHSREELTQAFGALLPAFASGSRQVYADWVDDAVTRSFAQLVHSLRDGRTAVMSRELDPQKIARQYEFAKRFERLRNVLVLFLRELSMTSQMRIDPFLRGYFFCGRRTAFIDSEPVGAGSPSIDKPDVEAEPASATEIFDPKRMTVRKTASPRAPRQPQERIESVFLPAVFRIAILADDGAKLVSGRNWRADLVRAWAIGAVALAALFVLVMLTVSYSRNRKMEKDLLNAATILRGTNPEDPIGRIEAMRPPVERLIRTYYDAPFSMTWGLNQAHSLMPATKTIYCAAVQERVIAGIRRRMESRLSAIVTSQGNPAEDYRLLKAYMMLTTHPDKTDAQFLRSQLMELAAAGGEIGSNSARGTMIGGQLLVYANLLAVPDERRACAFSPPDGLIASAQKHLRQLNLSDRYQTLLNLAGSGLEAVDYNARFPNEAVRNAHIIPGWFTRQGWDKMHELLRRPETSLRADAWVLDQKDDIEAGELQALAQQLGARYRNEYAAAWRTFISDGEVAKYASLKDAAAKLERMSGQRSVLLHLLGLASEHTAFDQMKGIFQPAHSVVKPGGEFLASDYLGRLDVLKNRLLKADQSTGAARDQDAQEVRAAATDGRVSVDALAQGFKGDSDRAVKELLLRPLTQIDELLRQQNAQAANGAGRDFCREMDAITRVLPFTRSAQSSTLDTAQRLLQPPGGRIWQFYNQVLQDSLTCTEAGCFIKENPKHPLTKPFERYFGNLVMWSRLLFPSGGDPVLKLQLQAAKFNYLQKIDVRIDDASVSLAAGSASRTSISWDLRRSNRFELSGTFEGEKNPQSLYRTDGQWAIFEWLANADPRSGGTDGFRWIPREGEFKPRQLENGHTTEYKVAVMWGDGSGRAFDWKGLSPGACVSVTR